MLKHSANSENCSVANKATQRTNKFDIMSKNQASQEGKTLPGEAETLRYKWIVLFCSFLVRLLVFGTVMSVGVLYVEWLDEFEMGLGNTALIGSIGTGSVLLMGK